MALAKPNGPAYGCFTKATYTGGTNVNYNYFMDTIEHGCKDVPQTMYSSCFMNTPGSAMGPITKYDGTTVQACNSVLLPLCPGGIINNAEGEYCRCSDSNLYKKSDGGTCPTGKTGIYAIEECDEKSFTQLVDAFLEDNFDSASTVSCTYDSCIQINDEGSAIAKIDITSYGTTEFVIYGMIDTSSMTAGKAKLILKQYKDDGSVIATGTIPLANVDSGKHWQNYGKSFELDSNTVKIILSMQTDSSSSGEALFSMPHLGTKEDDDGHDSCIETRCSDGENNDFDEVADVNDPNKLIPGTDMLDDDCYDMQTGQANKYYWDTTPRLVFLNYFGTVPPNDWFDPSARDGSDSACGDEKYYSCDSKHEDIHSCEDITSPELCLSYDCELSGGDVTCDGSVQCISLKDEDSCKYPCNWVGDSCETTNGGSAVDCKEYESNGDLNLCVRNGCDMTYEGEVANSGYCDGNYLDQASCDIEAGKYTDCDVVVCSDINDNEEDCNKNPLCGPWITDNNLNWDCYSNEYLGEKDPRFDCQKNSEEECIQDTKYCQITYYSNLRDLGFIDPTGQYLCADNSPTFIDAQGNKDQSLSEPGKNFVWRDAAGATLSPYMIQQIENTQFISNNKEWSFCNAKPTKFSQNVIPNKNKIPEYAHFDSEFDPGEEACVNPVAYILGKTGKTDIDVINCFEDSKGDCQTKYGQEYSSQEMAFCFNNVNHDEVLSYFRIETSEGNDFDACLDHCHYKSSNSNDLTNIRTYLQKLGENACDNLPPGYLNTCDGVGESGAGGDLTTEDTCYMNNNCPTETYSELSCDQISSIKTRICDDKINYYCADGDFITTKNPEEACCVGENAHCEEYSGEATCQDLGGDIKDPDKDGVCLGRIVGDDCCVDSVWTYNTQSWYLRSDAESFICYQSGNSNYFQECCDPVDNSCYNENNPLNGFGDIISTYSYKGVNLHTIVYFDNVVMSALSNPDADSRAILSIRNFDKWAISKPDFVKTDWTGFKGIGFNVRSLIEGSPTQLIIYDSDGHSHSYNFWDYVETNRNYNRANKMYFPLSEATEVDITKIDKIELVLKKSYDPVYIDNIYLVPDETLSGLDKINSETRYCSGLWKTWVEDLDGPLSSKNKGFVDEDISSLDLKDVQKYRDACDWSLYASWTGSLCCGDDANKDNGGEYYLDTGGLCWDGVPVLPGKTLATASGFTDDSLGPKMLFDAGKVYLCDVASDDDIFSQKIVYTPGTEEPGFVLTTANTINYELFGVKGNYICYPDVGWKIKTGTNRVRLLGNELGSIGDKEGDYTLFCSDDLEAMNVNNNNLFSAACALRTGSNADFDKDNTDVILGFVVADIDKPFNSEDGTDDVESYFLTFDPLIPVAEETDANGDIIKEAVNVEIDCTNAVDNPDDSEFFLECDVVNDNDKATDYKVYYNKPFNLVLLSSKKLTADNIAQLSFFSNFWDSFTGFFENLFGSNDNYEIPINFEKSDLSNFYISQQGASRLITGSMYDEGANNNPKVTARVDYQNLTTDVKFLAQAMQKDPKLPSSDTKVNYGIIDKYHQIIRVYSEDDDFNWKKFSSLLRLRDVQGDPTEFSPPVWGDKKAEYPEECDIDPGAANNIYLPGDIRIYKGECAIYDPTLYAGGTLSCIIPGYDNGTLDEYGNSGGLYVSRCEPISTDLCKDDSDCDDHLSETIDECRGIPKKCVHTSVPTVNKYCGDGHIDKPNDEDFYEDCDDGVTNNNGPPNGNCDSGATCSMACETLNCAVNPPATPSNVEATFNSWGYSGARVDITWHEPAGNPTGYTVERRTGTTGDWETLATTHLLYTQDYSALLETPEFNQDYYYRVSASNAGGTSSTSSSVLFNEPCPTSCDDYYSTAECDSITPKGCSALDCGTCESGKYCEFNSCQTPISGGGGGTCFIKDTMINTPNGKIRITDLKVGDVVYGYDDGEIVKAKVLTLFVHDDKPYETRIVKFDSGISFEVTPEHMVYVVDKDWIPVGDLVIGDNMLKLDGTHDKIVNISINNILEPVYNFETETHNYFAEGILVHNSKSAPGGTGGGGSSDGSVGD